MENPTDLDWHARSNITENVGENLPTFREETRDWKSSASICFRNLNVHGFGQSTDYQKTFYNYPLAIASNLIAKITQKPRAEVTILRNLDGLVNSGEMLLVLGRPGSGCTTLLKTLAGRTRGLSLHGDSMLNYQGVSVGLMHNEFRGECTYHAESTVHMPHLTVKETLMIPTGARTLTIEGGKQDTAEIVTQSENSLIDKVVKALNLEDAGRTKVGNDFVHGISGGERQRTSIAEIMLGYSSIQCWDNSTRGLDSSNALSFIRNLRKSTNDSGSVAIVTLYQTSQAIYEIFDKVCLLYEGRQVYFGPISAAKEYFLNLGYMCKEWTTTGDFLTSVTYPPACQLQLSSKFKAPPTSIELEKRWLESAEYRRLLEKITNYDKQYTLDDFQLMVLRDRRRKQRTRNLPQNSPYSVSVLTQVRLCLWRAIRVLRNETAPPISNIIGNSIMSIVLGSMFYNMAEDTNSFFGRGVLLFFTVLLNTFLGSFEGVALWDIRPVVEKHVQSALYCPSSEALASLICDIPNKIFLTLGFNIPFYFLANLRRTPSAFFTFYVFAFSSLLTGSMLFRTIGALSRSLTASIAPGAVFILMLVIYTGFVIPLPDMHPWFRWFNYVDPVAYAFESLMINEFQGRVFTCSRFVPEGPSYSNVSTSERICAAIGSRLGSNIVHGSDYLEIAFEYQAGHLWRNLGIIFAFFVGISILYFFAVEKIPIEKSTGEVLLFPRKTFMKRIQTDEENNRVSSAIFSNGDTSYNQPQIEAIPDSQEHGAFVWTNITYSVKNKRSYKQLINGVSGFVKPGTLTVVMGPSGAGKTTLLNILADRTSAGIMTGEVTAKSLTNKRHSIGGKIGYAQQNDIHLDTATVREALTFSALMRQSDKYTRAEKLAFVEHVINVLDMQEFAEAVIGLPGKGLNIEQRKKLTVAVELAMRPELLLLLDEPTSGLDSNTAWIICTLLKKLANTRQSILCTLHQPSTEIFQMFDKLLFINESGEQLYFGDIGERCKTVVKYFETRGARTFIHTENCAEWLFEVTSNQPKQAGIDWPLLWRTSKESALLYKQLETLRRDNLKPGLGAYDKPDKDREYAQTSIAQLFYVTRRNIIHDWRSPAYLYSKIFLTGLAGLFNGFSFWQSENNVQGIQNQLFSIFLLLTLFSNLVQLIMPHYIHHRDLYEARERPSRIYAWPIFVIASILVEVLWQTIMAAILFLTWYYPLGMWKHQNSQEIYGSSGLVFLFIWSFMIFSSTFSHLVITALPSATLGVNISSLLYSISLMFCGVLVPPDALPRFWIWMVRTTPLTYFVGGIAGAGLGNTTATCSSREILSFDPAPGQSCGEYLAAHLSYANGQILNPISYRSCQFCTLTETDTILKSVGIDGHDRWRNFGITIVFNVVNVLGTFGLYWLFRVSKKSMVRQIN